MRTLWVLVALLAAGATLGGCYAEYEVRPAQCRAVFVPGHYGAWGRWHRGHWRCV